MNFLPRGIYQPHLHVHYSEGREGNYFFYDRDFDCMWRVYPDGSLHGCGVSQKVSIDELEKAMPQRIDIEKNRRINIEEIRKLIE